MDSSSLLAPQPEISVGSGPAPLPDRVNAEPAIIKGLSYTESKWTISLAFLLWFPVGSVVGLALRHFPVAVLIIATGPIATVWLAAGYLATMKRNRPDHYYVQLLKRRAARLGLIRSHFVTHAGAWELGRTLEPPPVAKRRNPLC
ncbi:TIGR03750 family conjugal transfer protein [Aromatoleum evansii]|uniref:TIGR03750 family conjugal transfer protein n=1 Tax=Aromatoleum evansii TaxID=59406 RepID=UPI00145D32F3|nr:TIGR03750 family conjugal transfer protein [Aromatoleum evansii]NMG30175.1 TIGR03750 family conjugal transfer protein [Aromatoleum evansii]